jgi:tRNA threonylcarbamoyladenosine biosynthesis protein TsaB
MLLALDTSTRQTGVALYADAQVLHENVWFSKRRHTVELTPAIDAALAMNGHTLDDLKAVAVATGPGSYTGLRIGLAVAKGLALGRHLPLIGVPTFDILAYAQPLREETMFTVLEAGRGRLAMAQYRVKKEAWEMKGDPEVMTTEELSNRIRKPTRICGELNAEVRKILGRKHKNALIAPPALSLRRPSFLAELAWARWQADDTDDPATLAPYYLQVGDSIPA